MPLLPCGSVEGNRRTRLLANTHTYVRLRSLRFWEFTERNAGYLSILMEKVCSWQIRAAKPLHMHGTHIHSAHVCPRRQSEKFSAYGKCAPESFSFSNLVPLSPSENPRVCDDLRWVATLTLLCLLLLFSAALKMSPKCKQTTVFAIQLIVHITFTPPSSSSASTCMCVWQIVK